MCRAAGPQGALVSPVGQRSEARLRVAVRVYCVRARTLGTPALPPPTLHCNFCRAANAASLLGNSTRRTEHACSSLLTASYSGSYPLLLAVARLLCSEGGEQDAVTPVG